MESSILRRKSIKKELLPQTKIGEFLSIGVEMEKEEIGLYIASSDVSASCVFKFSGWEKCEDLKDLEEKGIFHKIGTTGKGTYYVLRGTKGANGA